MPATTDGNEPKLYSDFFFLHFCKHAGHIRKVQFFLRKNQNAKDQNHARIAEMRSKKQIITTFFNFIANLSGKTYNHIWHRFSDHSAFLSRILTNRMLTDVKFNNQGVLEVMSEERESGVVKWFNGAKGYGFISRESGEDLFVHFSEIQSEGYRVLNEGEKVEFTVAESDKGLQAKEVIKL